MKPKRINALWGVWLPYGDGCWCDHAQAGYGPEAYVSRRRAELAARSYRRRAGSAARRYRSLYGDEWLRCYAAPLTDAAAKIDTKRRRKR